MRIQVVSVPRSGSTYFYRMVARYTYGYKSGWPMGWGEWFNESLMQRQADRENKTYEQVKAWRCYVWKNEPEIVIKTQTDFLKDETIRNVCLDNNIYNIFFYRRNIFDMAMSMQIAHYTNEYVHYNHTDEFAIEQKYLINSIEYYINEYEKIKSGVYKLKFNEIVAYEDLTFNEDTDFHNLDISNYTSQKTKKAPNKRRVENYDELESEVRDRYGDKLMWDYNDK